MAELITVDVDTAGDTVTVRAGGEIDLSTVAEFRDALHRATVSRPARIIIDLTRVTFMSVGALRPIEEAARALRADTGGHLVLGDRSRAADRVLTHLPIDPLVQGTSSTT